MPARFALEPGRCPLGSVPARVAAVIGGLQIVLIGLAYLATWGGAAGPVTYLVGQRPPGIRLSPDGGAGPPRRVRMRLETGAPVHEVSPRYLSVAVDTSQLVGGDWWDPKARSLWRQWTAAPTVPPVSYGFFVLEEAVSTCG